jgi:hypothetical protein
LPCEQNLPDHEPDQIIAWLFYQLAPVELFFHRIIAPHRPYADRHGYHHMGYLGSASGSSDPEALSL